MSEKRKVIGVTVGTPLSPSKIKEKFSPLILQSPYLDDLDRPCYILDIGKEYKGEAEEVIHHSLIGYFSGGEGSAYSPYIFAEYPIKEFTIKIIGFEGSILTYEYNGEIRTYDCSVNSELTPPYELQRVVLVWRGDFYLCNPEGIKGGEDGKDGKTPYIKDGNWWIGETDTGVKAEGIDGVGILKVEKTATNGNIDTYTITYTNGSTFTFTVTNGLDGFSPTVSVEAINGGHRVIITDKNGEKKVNILNGADGRGISSVLKTSTSGLVDTYTITYTDKTTATFTVTNGKAGTSVTVTNVSESTADGGSNVVTFSDGKTLTVKNGRNGANGKTPYVKNNTWWIGDTDTGIKAEGTDGKGIKSFLKISTNGLVDTYRITYTDGTTTAIDVTNGKDGHTPIKGVDYYTEADKAEFSEFIASELAKRGQLKPEFANSIEECTDTTKLYVLPDGYIYAYMLTKKEVIVGGYTNQLKDKLLLNHRISVSGDTPVLKYHDGTVASASSSDTIYYIPVKGGDIIRVNRPINPNFDKGYARIAYFDIEHTKVAPSSDSTAVNLHKLTETDGVTSWTVGYDNTGTKFSAYDDIEYMIIGINIHTGTEVVESEVSDLILTVNEEIKEGKTEIVETYAWESTEHAFVPADYENRIIELEAEVEDLNAEIETLNGKLEKANTAKLAISEVFAPSPQLPADGSETADFNGSDISCNDIYNYIDALLSVYPQYISKETMGKDESGNYDWNRYILCRRYYDAWQKVNYPMMYAWVNGSTVIYSVSVSPRIGDTLYTTTYIGTAKGTVTAVDNANQTRTVEGVVYTRDKSKDVEPTLVFTETSYNLWKRTKTPNVHRTIYNNEKTSIGTFSTHSSFEMTDSAGNTYTRYPLGDRNKDFNRLKAIVIGANEHGVNGDPPEPAIVTARLAKDLCECKQADNPFLNLLKNEYMVILCPVINPYGFTHGPYTNANDVNIDRNFDTLGWHNDTTAIGGSGDYGGSENETQYFMNTLTEAKPIVATANHCLGSGLDATTGEASNAICTAWMFGENKEEYMSPLLDIAEIMYSNYNLIFKELSSTSEAPPESYAKTRSYITHEGIIGGAIEMQAREGFVLEGEGNLHTARVLEADYTLLLQFLHMLIKVAEGINSI